MKTLLIAGLAAAAAALTLAGPAGAGELDRHSDISQLQQNDMNGNTRALPRRITVYGLKPTTRKRLSPWSKPRRVRAKRKRLR